MSGSEQGTCQQVTIKYNHGCYYLQVQCLLVSLSEPKLHLPLQPTKIIMLNLGICTFHGIADLEGCFGEIGEVQVEYLVCIAKKADHIQVQIDTQLQGHSQKDKQKRARCHLR